MKRFLSIILSIFLIVGCLPLTAVVSSAEGTLTLPYYNDFDSPDPLEGWTMRDCENTTGLKEGMFAFRFTNYPPQYLISPELPVTSKGKTISFDFKVQAASYQETFCIGYSTTTDETDAFLWDSDITADNLSFSHYSETFPAKTKYFAIKCSSNDKYYLYIDNLSIVACDFYDLFIGGIQITSDNADDITAALNAVNPGSATGTASYTPATAESPAILSLDNFNYEGTGPAVLNNSTLYSTIDVQEDLIIDVSGDCSVKYADGNVRNTAIYASADCDLTVRGDGSIKFTGGNVYDSSGYGNLTMGMSVCSNLTVAGNVELLAQGGESTVPFETSGSCSSYGCSFTGPEIKLCDNAVVKFSSGSANGKYKYCFGLATNYGNDYAFNFTDSWCGSFTMEGDTGSTREYGSLTVTGQDVTVTGYEFNGLDLDYDPADYSFANFYYNPTLVIRPYYEKQPIYVSGIRVTENNYDDVLEDGGSVKYDKASDTLILNNANIEAEGLEDNDVCTNGIRYGIWDGDSTTRHTLKIKAIGNNTVKGASADSTYPTSGAAVYYDNWNLSFELADGATLSLIGGNSETSQNGSYGIYAESSTVSVSGKGTLNATAGKISYRDYWMTTAGIFCKSLTVSGDVTVNATGGECVAASCGIILQNGGTLKLVDNATVNCKGGNILTDITLNPAAAGYAKKNLKASAPFYCSSGLGIYGSSVNYKIVMDIKGWKGDFTAEGGNLAFSPVYRYDYNTDSPIIEVFAVDDWTMDYVHFDSYSDPSSSTPDASGYTQYPLDEGVCRGYKKCVLHPYRTFPDVPEGSWFYDSVKKCTLQGIIKGYSNGNFGPSDNLQRQDFVVMLARFYNADLETYAKKASQLSDITSGQYYTGAVNWAVENGFITGYTSGAKAGKFGVGDPITREQIAAILYRIACNIGGFDGNVNNYYKELGVFEDEAKISSYATDAMAWAVHHGYITGMNPTTLNPSGLASRAQIATILNRVYL